MPLTYHNALVVASQGQWKGYWMTKETKPVVASEDSFDKLDIHVGRVTDVALEMSGDFSLGAGLCRLSCLGYQKQYMLSQVAFGKAGDHAD